MPHRPRLFTSDHVFHILNRSAGKRTILETPADYETFLRCLEEARQIVPARLLAYCLMPNHWHLVIWPREDGDTAKLLHWLTSTHGKRWHRSRGTRGTGPVYQGRYKSFPIQEDHHLVNVLRYVERNALSAGLVDRAEDWRWGSLHSRIGVAGNPSTIGVDPGPLEISPDWVERVNAPQPRALAMGLQHCMRRGTPFGDPDWCQHVARKLGLERALRAPGRPLRSPSQTSTGTARATSSTRRKAPDRRRSLVTRKDRAPQDAG